MLAQGENRPFDPHGFVRTVALLSRTDGKTPDPELGIGRECYAFSEIERRVHVYTLEIVAGILRNCAEGRDYIIERDAAGSLFVTYFGSDRSLAPFMVHSHLDSVQNGGTVDGVAGVASALSILEDVAARPRPLRSLRIGVYVSEESAPKNGVGCLGSAIATGTIAPERLERIQYDGSRMLSEVFGASWPKVLAESMCPVITRENTAGSLELHIEQSALVATEGAEIGIVTPGIGGAYRAKLKVRLQSRIINGFKPPLSRLTLEFTGAADHTGGTPPNPSFFRSGPTWYRRDALVAACFGVNFVLRRQHAGLVRCAPSAETGYTSIPLRQLAELAIPRSQEVECARVLAPLPGIVRERFGVDLRWRIDESIEKPEYVDPKRVVRFLNLPLMVSILSTKAFQRERASSPYGTTRATVVDFTLKPEELSFKLDLREVDERDLDALRTAIVRRVRLVFGRNALEYVSRKHSQRVDTRIVAALKEAATELGISYIEMPSLPGHDSDRHAEAGIPVGMVFVRQEDGVSHSPHERMRSEDFDVAHRVMRAAVLTLLER